MFSPSRMLPFLLASASLLPAAFAQDTPQAHKQQAEPKPYGADYVTRTYSLKNRLQQNDAMDVTIALRNMLNAEDRIYMVTSENIIAVYAPPSQQEIAAQIVRTLDVAKPVYRISYTVTQIDGGKRAGTQHYSMLAVAGQRATLKQGSKVPVLTGPSPGSDKVNAQYQYLDVGMNFSVQADAYGSGVNLRSKVEQSSVSEETSSVGLQDPIVRQAVLESEAVFPVGKPMLLGSLDVPGSTRKLDIEVMVEPVM